MSAVVVALTADEPGPATIHGLRSGLRRRSWPCGRRFWRVVIALDDDPIFLDDDLREDPVALPA